MWVYICSSGRQGELFHVYLNRSTLGDRLHTNVSLSIFWVGQTDIFHLCLVTEDWSHAKQAVLDGWWGSVWTRQSMCSRLSRESRWIRGQRWNRGLGWWVEGGTKGNFVTRGSIYTYGELIRVHSYLLMNF